MYFRQVVGNRSLNDTDNRQDHISVLGGSMSGILRVFSVLLLVTAASWASLTNVYIAQNATGADSGADCANAHAASFFNTSTNWGTGSSQIGPGSTVHLCGTWTGGNATTFLKLQGSGSNGSVVTLLFEAGAALQPNYCASSGCVDLNGQSYIVIDGGTTCGETGHWSTTQCNGTIQNMLAGSSGATCPGGACSPLSGTTYSIAIGSSSNSPTNVEIRNLHIHLYTRLASDKSDGGMGTYGLGLFGGTLAQSIVMHNMMIDGVAKGYLVSLGTSTGTVSNYSMYNSSISNMCWAMGVGANAPSLNITALEFHDNEVSAWDNWAVANTGNACHTNGTMWFNGDGSTVHTTAGFIGDPSSMIYDNFLHGSLTGNYSGSSPSGYLSCQDNCVDIAVFNNIIVDTTTGANGGGAIYFNGAGGGRQRVYNNTLVRPNGSMVVATGVAGQVQVSNNVMKCTGTNCAAIEIRPNTPTAVISNLNDGFQIGAGSWTIYNSASSGTFLSLASWRSMYGQDVDTLTGDPALTASYAVGANSPAIGLGANLSSLGITALDSDVFGMARVSSGKWNAGAGGPIFEPPTNLTASVH